MYIALAALILIGLSIPCLFFWLICYYSLSPRFPIRPLLSTLLCMLISFAAKFIFQLEFPGGQGSGIVIIVTSMACSFLLLVLTIAFGRKVEAYFKSDG